MILLRKIYSKITYLFSRFNNRLINKFVSLLIRISKESFIDLYPLNKETPLFLMGMFRSGTSLTSEILNKSGINFGKNFRLLKSQGRFKKLNPNGFYEDFLFAQLSRYLFKMLNSSGANPPLPEEVDNLNIKKINLAEFIRFSYFENKEDRISKKHQFIALLYLKMFKLKYLTNKKGKYAVKIPMLVPFYELLINIYPKAEFLIIIRNPDSTISSSKALTDKSSLDLYDKYYIHLYDLYKKYSNRTFVFSYDNLLKEPEYSIKILAQKYNLSDYKKAFSIIDKKYIRNQTQYTQKSFYYDFLNNIVINKLS